MNAHSTAIAILLAAATTSIASARSLRSSSAPKVVRETLVIEEWVADYLHSPTQGHKWGCRPGEENNCSEEKEDKGLYFKRTGN
mgnify:CR=1 FL=1